jgi:hypothetical protein
MAVTQYNNNTSSRLLIGTEQLRETLLTRNLYTPDVEYPSSSQQAVNKTVSTINTIISAIAPFKSFNINNTIAGRLVTSQRESPLVEIGLVMLAKQFAYNSMSSLAQQNFPIMNTSNLFDKNPATKLFTKQINDSITIRSGASTLSNFVRSAVYWYPTKDYPFNPSSGRDQYILNTGEGQLKDMYGLINKNIYKPTFNNSANEVYYNTAYNVGNPLMPRNTMFTITDKVFFNYNSSYFNPYNTLYSQTVNTFKSNIVRANESMIYAYNHQDAEYAPNVDYIIAMGHSSPVNKTTLNPYINEWIDNKTEFIGDLPKNENSIVWGRDGINPILNGALSELRGEFGNVNSTISPDSEIEFTDKFDVTYGLLEYTRNIVKATQGLVGDITRKAFVDKNNHLVGFNGSPLWNSNGSDYSRKVNPDNKTGVRQHSVLDQYDRFAKAIRFNGNFVYGGNQNSVIFNKVMPNINPTKRKVLDFNVVDNTNLMFSIENLAIRTTALDGNKGFIDDEYGSEIPITEVGPFNGRYMWFPPYAIEINETASAKYESTVMVGRNEPMYNYQNSERTATVTFTMLIDYPPQVKDYENNVNSQRDIAEFFAFGGNGKPAPSTVKNIQAQIQQLENEKNAILGGGKKRVPLDAKNVSFKMYFPNDVPRIKSTVDNIDTVVDTMYNDFQYEIRTDVKANIDFGTTGTLNDTIYYINGLVPFQGDGMTYYKVGTPQSQYTATADIDQFGNEVVVNKLLKTVFSNEDMCKFYVIDITGAASKLFKSDYNYYLGLRRAGAAKTFMEKKIQALFGKSASALGITFSPLKSLGEKGASIIGESKTEINNNVVKQDRYAEITIKRNSESYKPVVEAITLEDELRVESINNSIDVLTKQLNDAKTKTASNDDRLNPIMNERSEDDTAILHGFRALSENYYQPIFHSQTPEDFHKRLTFLQQCTRQGASKRFNVKVDSEGIARERNSVFGRQPICILRIGDFFYTKVIIESVNFDYSDTMWDMNPEGFGMQPMMAKITLNMKIIGGQSLKGPIDALQNAVAFNYYANSNYTDKGTYILPSAMAEIQDSYRRGISTTDNPILKQFNKNNAERKAAINNSK